MKDKVVFITGAKGGLGSFITRRFLRVEENAVGFRFSLALSAVSSFVRV
jgi:NAD(P)-dependent dehydrogenase (short-subunit alcohol dehydrogenase family)